MFQRIYLVLPYDYVIVLSVTPVFGVVHTVHMLSSEQSWRRLASIK